MAVQQMNSPVGNSVLQRQRLSAIRQRTGLESGRSSMAPQSNMRSVAPSPEAPANKPGAAIQTASSSPMIADGSGANPNSDQLMTEVTPGLKAIQSGPTAPGLRPVVNQQRLLDVTRNFLQTYRPQMQQHTAPPPQGGGWQGDGWQVNSPPPTRDEQGRRPPQRGTNWSGGQNLNWRNGEPQARTQPMPNGGGGKPSLKQQGAERQRWRVAQDFLWDKLGRRPSELEMELFLANGPR